MGDGGGGHWLVRMEQHPAGWSVCLPLLISPCTIKSRSSLLAPAHPGGPRKRAVKRLWCVVWWYTAMIQHTRGADCHAGRHYIANIVPYPAYKGLRHGHTVLPSTYTMLAFFRKHSPDGATPNWCSRHPIAAYYSFVNLEWMKGWVGLVGWPIVDGLPT